MIWQFWALNFVIGVPHKVLQIYVIFMGSFYVHTNWPIFTNVLIKIMKKNCLLVGNLKTNMLPSILMFICPVKFISFTLLCEALNN